MELKNTIFRRTLPFKESEMKLIKDLLIIAIDDINDTLKITNGPNDYWLNYALCSYLVRRNLLPNDSWDNDLVNKINPKLAHQIHVLAVLVCNSCPVFKQCNLETKAKESTIRAGKKHR